MKNTWVLTCTMYGEPANAKICRLPFRSTACFSLSFAPLRLWVSRRLMGSFAYWKVWRTATVQEREQDAAICFDGVLVSSLKSDRWNARGKSAAFRNFSKGPISQAGTGKRSKPIVDNVAQDPAGSGGCFPNRRLAFPPVCLLMF